MKRIAALGAACIVSVLLHSPVLAELKTIETSSPFIPLSTDGEQTARRIAVQEAHREVADLAGAFLARLSPVMDHHISSAEVKAYAAGVAAVEIVSEEQRGPADRPAISVRARWSIDTDLLVPQLIRAHENECLRQQFLFSAAMREALKKEQNSILKQLSVTKNKFKTDTLRKRLDAVLLAEEADDETGRLWAVLAGKLENSDERGQEVSPAELDSAVTALERAVAASPRDQRAHTLLADVYLRKGNEAGAEKELRSAIHHGPSNPVPHVKLGLLLRTRGAYQEALREFHFVERLHTRNLPAVFYSAMTYKDMGKCGKAVQYFNRFLKNPLVESHPKKKEQAIQAVEDCGGNRPGRKKRAKAS